MLGNLSDRKTVIILGIIIFIATVFFSINNFYPYYSFDEAFTILLIDNNLIDLIKTTGRDVHPPLYYIMLKIFVLIFGHNVFVIKTFSLLGVIFTMLLSIWPIRRLFGNKVSILFALFFLLLPATQYLSGEMRMYSWCTFFVTCAGISSYMCYTKSHFKNWICYIIFVLLTAYTHNYGLLTVGFMSLALFIALLYQKNKKALVYFLVSLTICVLLHIPWFLVLLNQINLVVGNGDTWIWTPTFYEVLKYSFYIFDAGARGIVFEFLGFLLTILLIVLLITSIRIQNKKKFVKSSNFLFAIIYIIVFLSITVFGTSVTLLYKPVFVARYMVVGMGLFALGCAILLVNLDFSIKKIKILSIIFIFLLSGHTLYRVYRINKDHRIKLYNKDQVDLFIKSYVEDSTVFVYNIAAYTNEDLFKFKLRYPERTHIIYSQDKFRQGNGVYNTFDSLSVKYNTLILSGELWGNYNIVSNRDVLKDLTKTYQIRDSIISYENTVIYFLIKNDSIK